MSIRDICVRFAGIVALDGVSVRCCAGGICGLIGPNGAGKTTLFNCLSRLYTPTRGAITFQGQPLLGLPAHKIAQAGIGRTFQNLALFRTLSVRQNILAGAHGNIHANFFSDALRLPAVRREEAQLSDEADELIDLLDLRAVAELPVDSLTFSVKKRIELARALAGKPKLLLLDEPAGGLNHDEVEQLRKLILTIRDRLKLTVLLVEHHMNLVMRVSDKVVALDFGRKIADGTPADVQGDPGVYPCLSGDRSMNTMLQPLLALKGVDAAYGQSQVLYDLDLEVADGGITALLGANGAGKTTTLRTICNMRVRASGTVIFDGMRIDGLQTEDIVRRGIAHVPDGRGTFVHLTVEENPIVLGAYSRRDRTMVAQDIERVLDYFPRLRERLAQQAGLLSGGEQQMLAIARALMLRPRLLLLDEPSFGLAPLIVQEIFRILSRINIDDGVSMLLVEQNANLALSLAHNVYLLETGRVVLAGPAETVRGDDSVRRAYLGY